MQLYSRQRDVAGSSGRLESRIDEKEVRRALDWPNLLSGAKGEALSTPRTISGPARPEATRRNPLAAPFTYPRRAP